MAHHLNTNKQFMVGNGILAFAVIFVVVIFIYMKHACNGKTRQNDIILKLIRSAW